MSALRGEREGEREKGGVMDLSPLRGAQLLLGGQPGGGCPGRPVTPPGSAERRSPTRGNLPPQRKRN